MHTDSWKEKQKDHRMNLLAAMKALPFREMTELVAVGVTHRADADIESVDCLIDELCVMRGQDL